MREKRKVLYMKKTAICPECGGTAPKSCPRCYGVGLALVPATRRDSFRRMTDRELAEELFQFRFDGYAKAMNAETVLPDTVAGIEEWLKEEMTE